MATEYTIYLQNESANTQLFWAFLQRPEQLVDDPGVFANSSTMLAVPPNSPATDTFTIPVQYSVGAGASNQAVGLDIKVESMTTLDADLTQGFMAHYYNWPPPMGPTLVQSGSSPANTIAIESNPFDKVNNDANSWFANQSFGIQTAQGYIGMTWSPDPNQTRTITPKLSFYVSVGSYGSNQLASWNQVSNSSAELSVPSSFSQRKSTVTYTSSGEWVVTPGAPSLAASTRRLFAMSYYELSKGLRRLTEGLSDDQEPTQRLSPSPFSKQSQKEELVSVEWSKKEKDDEASDVTTFLSGKLTVGSALTAGFAVFILSGITFNITSAPVGGTTVSFTYSGDQSAEAIKKLFKAGAELLFRQAG